MGGRFGKSAGYGMGQGPARKSFECITDWMSWRNEMNEMNVRWLSEMSEWANEYLRYLSEWTNEVVN